jgi:hypothetical protein
VARFVERRRARSLCVYAAQREVMARAPGRIRILVLRVRVLAIVHSPALDDESVIADYGLMTTRTPMRSEPLVKTNR